MAGGLWTGEVSQDLGSRLSFATTNMMRAWANPFPSEIVPARFCALTASWGQPVSPTLCTEILCTTLKTLGSAAHTTLRTIGIWNKGDPHQGTKQDEGTTHHVTVTGHHGSDSLCLPPHVTLQSCKFLAPTASSLGKYPPINEAIGTKLKSSSTSFPCPNRRSIHSFLGMRLSRKEYILLKHLSALFLQVTSISWVREGPGLLLTTKSRNYEEEAEPSWAHRPNLSRSLPRNPGAAT